MGIRMESLLGTRYPHELQEVNGTLARFGMLQPEMLLDRLTDLGPNAKKWIEGGHWILENHGHVVARDMSELFVVEAASLAAVKAHLSTHDTSGRMRNQAHERQRCKCLAAARFADEADRLARGQDRASRHPRHRHDRISCLDG